MERVSDLKLPFVLSAATYKISMFLSAIRFQESVFALPFAYTAMILAAEGLPTIFQFCWISVAMVAARTVGMASNRVIDRHIDAQNPRNASRHIPSGKITARDMVILTVVSLGIFIYSAYSLNLLAFLLSPLAAAYLVLYPYTKRFTWLSNILLGWALAIAPAAAWIGVKGELSWEPVILSLGVALWAGSFDILYHTQDHDFHRKAGLHSVASRFGINIAFRMAKVMDALAVTALLLVGIMLELSWPYFVGVILAAALLVYRHSLISPSDLSRMGVAFMRINAYVSITIMVGTLISMFLIK